MNQENKKRIRRAMLAAKTCTKLRLSRDTGLSLATCGNILNELTRTGEVLACGMEQSRGGRPARTYAYNVDFRFSLCLYADTEAGAPRLGYDIVNMLGRVRRSGFLRPEVLDAEGLGDCILRLLAENPRIVNVIIGLPGAVDRAGNIGACDIPALANCALGERLAERIPVSVSMENDINLCALGCCALRDEAEAGTVAVVDFPLDGCAGAGFIADGQILRGSSSFAGEVSYLPFSRPNCPVTEQTADEEERIRYMANVVCTISAVLDPRVIVLTGALVREELLPRIRALCGGIIPQTHLPELLCHGDREADYRRGLIVRAMQCQERMVDVREEGEVG